MNTDTNMDDFYVTASFSPYLKNHNLMSNDKSIVQDNRSTYGQNVYDFLLDENTMSSSSLYDLILTREKSRIRSSEFHEKFNVNFTVAIESFYKKNSGQPSIILKREELDQYLPTIKDEQIFVSITNETFLHKHHANLTKKVVSNVKKCPKQLSKKHSSIINTCKLISELDSFISYSSKTFKDSVNYKDIGSPSSEFILRIKIPKPEFLIELSNLILIEGPPGCGKTTLLKKMAVSLLEKSKKIKYVNCYTVTKSFRSKSLIDIVGHHALGELHRDYKNSECVLILDGLDESPFDMTSAILKNYTKYKSVVLSSRTAYSAGIRAHCFNIKLSPFSSQERNEFFKKILQDDITKIEQANYLFETYPGIDNHTKLPIIATLTATLLNNGFTPTTRAEIYNFRLELLLSKWDRSKGVSRIEIDNPNAKIIFLKKLAYHMHNLKTRNRSITVFDLRETYEKALGSWGYEFNFNTFIDDLVKGSGVLIEISPKKYTFGHLSFQEHLAGEYLAENCSTAEILRLLGNDWWREPLYFWASSEGNITKLLNKVFDNPDYLGFSEQLREMCKCAPYTSAAIVEILEEEKKNIFNEI
jgi:energy-coupling factor transporter ATP-binding protein EcfA2